MINMSLNILLFILVGLLLNLNPIISKSVHVDAVKFTPVPFNNIPIAVINSENSTYNLEADFSIDYGDEPVIENNQSAKYIINMELHISGDGSSLMLQCDSNDVCGTSLAPTSVKIYLVDSDIEDNQIANKSIPMLELADNDCGTHSIEDCANFDFSIPSNILLQDYKIVVDMSFDEAEWLFINPVKIR
ncbi:MAG: hypothetical protein ACRD97_12295 [Nitrososphaeraceae archaeon]